MTTPIHGSGWWFGKGTVPEKWVEHKALWTGPEPSVQARWQRVLDHMRETKSLPNSVRDEGSCSIPRGETRQELNAKFFSSVTEPEQQDGLEVLETRDQLWQQYCKDCPVLKECFDWAVEREDYGIWAGSTQHDRYRARQSKELMEYGKNRVRAGYKPYPGQKCVVCGKPSPEAECGKCSRAAKKRVYTKTYALARQRGHTTVMATRIASRASWGFVAKRYEERLTSSGRRYDQKRGYQNAQKHLRELDQALKGVSWEW